MGQDAQRQRGGNSGSVSRNCKRCNGKVILRKRTPAMYMGNCKPCQKTYVLHGPAVQQMTIEMKLKKAA
jgi:hypothetical protein